MATKRVELEQAAKGLGCLGKAEADEPVFKPKTAAAKKRKRRAAKAQKAK